MELQQHYHQLITNIGQLLAAGREKAAHQVNTILVQTYWEIGRHIVEYSCFPGIITAQSSTIVG